MHWSADIDIARQPAVDQREMVLLLGRSRTVGGRFDSWQFGGCTDGHVSRSCESATAGLSPSNARSLRLSALMRSYGKPKTHTNPVRNSAMSSRIGVFRDPAAVKLLAGYVPGSSRCTERTSISLSRRHSNGKPREVAIGAKTLQKRSASSNVTPKKSASSCTGTPVTPASADHSSPVNSCTSPPQQTMLSAICRTINSAPMPVKRDQPGARRLPTNAAASSGVRPVACAKATIRYGSAEAFASACRLISASVYTKSWMSDTGHPSEPNHRLVTYPIL